MIRSNAESGLRTPYAGDTMCVVLTSITGCQEWGSTVRIWLKQAHPSVLPRAILPNVPVDWPVPRLESPPRAF